MYKKFFKYIILVFIFSISISKISFAESMLHQKQSTSIVSKGVKKQHIKRFTNNGWININVLRIDLTNPHIELDTIFSKKGISTRSTILQMANDNNAISAINGDFFSTKPGTNLAHCMGPVIQNEKLISTPTNKTNKFKLGVFALSKNNKPFYTYWSNKISLIAPNGKRMQIKDINKFGWYTSLYMYDKNWGPKSVGKSEKFPTLKEMVVVNNKVQKFNIASGPIKIPENGFVIAGDQKAGNFLKNNFKIGDRVKIIKRTIPNWNYFKTAIGGGSFLVKRGKIPRFSHNIDGLHPRTAIGTTKDNKQAILVAVDGRQLASKGMTQTQLANLMVELGAYNAINLDGGGSTTMVSRELGTKELEIVNKYSDNNPRPVINGIGVFSNASKGNLNGTKIKTLDTNIFKNSSRIFNIVGYDKNYNPVKIDSQKVKWKCKGISGKFIDNRFYPTSTGKGKVIAKIDDITSSINIKVLDYPVELVLSTKTLKPSKHDQNLKVTGKDKDGYEVNINLKDITFNPKSAIEVTSDNIKLKNTNIDFLKASFGNVYSYIKVASQNIILDNFEQNSNKFWGYPETVKGNYTISDKYSKAGNSSGKLKFDFSNTQNIKAAYVKFSEGYKIESKPKNIKLWAYSPLKHSHSIKAEFVDYNNKVFRTTFSSKIDWTGWKHLQTKTPDNIKFPITLRKIYVVQTNSKIKDKGKIFFDKLQCIYDNNLRVPPSKKIRDYEFVDKPVKPTKNSFSIAVYGNDYMPNTAVKKINKNSSYGAFIQPIKQAEKLKIPHTTNRNNFSISEFKNSMFITMSSKGTNSIRKNNPKQWTSLFNTLKNNNKDNIFILLNSSILSFSDQFEKNLLQNTLSKFVKNNNKNIWVLYNSPKTNIFNKNGVKYIGVKNKFSTRYLSITVNKKNISYYFDKIY